MGHPFVESFELLVEAEQLGPRLDAAAVALAQLPALDEERQWLAAARARLDRVRAGSHGDLLNRALRLPELEGLRADRAKLIQGGIADGFEQVQAGIAYAGGPRSPLLEMLVHNLKVPALRKCGRAELERFCLELERRLASSYARRMFANEPYVVVTPTVQALEGAIATWRGVFSDQLLGDAAAAALGDELVAAGQAVDIALRQARLLAQAALLPATDLLDAAGVLTAKGKRRGQDDALHPMLEHDPPDPFSPTAEERAELAALSSAPAATSAPAMSEPPARKGSEPTATSGPAATSASTATSGPAATSASTAMSEPPARKGSAPGTASEAPVRKGSEPIATSGPAAPSASATSEPPARKGSAPAATSEPPARKGSGPAATSEPSARKASAPAATSEAPARKARAPR